MKPISGRRIFIGAAMLPLIFVACVRQGALPLGANSALQVEKGLIRRDIGSLAADLQGFVPPLMERARIPGLQIALLREGGIAWHHSFGVRNAVTSEPVTDETIFEAASLTKPLFAYYVMKLVDRGVLSLDKPLLDSLPANFVEGFLGHSLGEKGFRRDWFEKITVRHILSHSSGMPHGESARPYPLFFEPGTSWKYSAEGYLFLQRAVEHLLGGRLEDLMQKEILDPLGMTGSALVWKAEFEPAMAHGHGFFVRPEAFRRRTEAHAGASLYTTAEDYAKFMTAVLSGRDLRPETFKAMLTRQVDMDKEKGVGWCLGFGTQSDANGQAIWQWGDFGIFRGYVIAYPEIGSGVIYLTNSFYGMGICPDIVGRSLGGKAWGSVVLDYPPYDSPLYRFAWELEAEGPRAVNKLKGLMKKYPKIFDQGAISSLAESFQDADLFPQALALIEFGFQGQPRSGSERAVVAWHREYSQRREREIKLEEAYLKNIAGDYGPRRLQFKDGRLHYLRKGGANPDGRPLIAVSRDTFIVDGSSHFRLKIELDGKGDPVKLIVLYIDGAPAEESLRRR